MKLVTQDYGCGTSSSILDYGIKDVVIVSPTDYEHVFDVDDDLFFIGHDFLLFLWDTQEKIDAWKNYPHSKIVWCFEPIDAIFQSWRQKSHFSMACLMKFVDEVFVCHEPDADNYNFKWLPQWASPIFFEKRLTTPTNGEKILFSGQAGKPEYKTRNELLLALQKSEDFSNKIFVSNISRGLSWADYVSNLLSYNFILNPYGILNAFNTRAYEVLYSGRTLLQHTSCEYARHFGLLKGHDNVITFQNFNELSEKLSDYNPQKVAPDVFFADNNIYARFKSIGIEIK